MIRQDPLCANGHTGLTCMSVNMCVTLGSGFPDDVAGVRFCFGIDGEVIIAKVEAQQYT